VFHCTLLLHATFFVNAELTVGQWVDRRSLSWPSVTELTVGHWVDRRSVNWLLVTELTVGYWVDRRSLSWPLVIEHATVFVNAELTVGHWVDHWSVSWPSVSELTVGHWVDRRSLSWLSVSELTIGQWVADCRWQAAMETLVPHNGTTSYQTFVHPEPSTCDVSACHQPSSAAFQPLPSSVLLTSSQGACPLPTRPAHELWSTASAAVSQSASLPQFDPVNNTASPFRPQSQRDVISQCFDQLTSGEFQLEVLAVHGITQTAVVCTCLSVCLSVCHMLIKQTTQHCSQGTLVFFYLNTWWNSIGGVME